MKRAIFALLLALAASPALGQEPNTTAAKLVASSGNVIAATATASLAAAPGLMNYVCSFSITGSGATTAVIVQPTITGLNGGTLTFTVGVIAGVLLNQPPLDIRFTPCQPATALNTAITLSVPSFGSGNTNVTANIFGYRLPY
jgi:hypothetical protein